MAAGNWGEGCRAIGTKAVDIFFIFFELLVLKRLTFFLFFFELLVLKRLTLPPVKNRGGS